MRSFYFLVLLLLLLPLTTAIGITPPSAKINFAPGMEGDFDILILNSRSVEIDTTANVTGDLHQYITATTPRVGARDRATATISFALPDDISPGLHRQYIWFGEDFFDPTIGGVAAKTSVGFRIDIWKPYPGKYAELSVAPRHVKQGDNTDMKVLVKSRGDQPLKGDIDVRVYDADGRLHETYSLNDFEVEANTDKHRFIEVLSRDWKPGAYDVKATYDYGAAVAQTEAVLKIGSRDVSILNATGILYLDTSVNRFDIVVDSLWNEPLPEVSASYQVGSNTGRTPSITLAPFERKTLTGYWDTDPNVGDGERSALVTVVFRDGEPVTRTFPVTVYNETPQPQVEEPSSITLGLTDVLFLAVLLLVLIAFALHLYRKPHV